MKLLEALNSGLPYLRAPEVTTDTARHPMVGVLRSAIQRQLDILLDRALWFNVVETELLLDNAGRIEAPANTRTLYTLGLGAPLVEARGEYLYNLTDVTDIFTEPLSVKLVQEMGFEEVPNAAASLVRWQAALEVYSQRFDAGDSTAQRLSVFAAQAEQLLEREHLRKKKFNSHSTGAAARIVSALKGL